MLLAVEYYTAPASKTSKCCGFSRKTYKRALKKTKNRKKTKPFYDFMRTVNKVHIAKEWTECSLNTWWSCTRCTVNREWPKSGEIFFLSNFIPFGTRGVEKYATRWRTLNLIIFYCSSNFLRFSEFTFERFGSEDFLWAVQIIRKNSNDIFRDYFESSFQGRNQCHLLIQKWTEQRAEYKFRDTSHIHGFIRSRSSMEK